MLLIALAVYLFSKAVAFEKMMLVETPEQVAQNNQIEEIREQVDYLHSLKHKSAEDGLRNVGDEYKTTRIVAWLLNRSVESQKAERE